MSALGSAPVGEGVDIFSIRGELSSAQWEHLLLLLSALDSFEYSDCFGIVAADVDGWLKQALGITRAQL